MSHYFWDWVTLNLLVGQAVFYYVVTRTKLVKNFVIKTLAATLLFFGFSVIFYGSFIEPNIIVTRHVSIDLRRPIETLDGQNAVTPKADGPIKIALISDLHLGPYHGKWFVNQVINKIKKSGADILIIAGDSVYDSANAASALKLFKTLPILKVAAMGNHDYNLEFDGDLPSIDEKRAETVKQSLWSGDVKVLPNKYVHYQGRLWILGVDEYWTERGAVKPLLDEINNDAIKIMVSHNPDAVKMLTDEKIDLVLSGHTHGGQVRLPWLGPIGKIPTKLGQSYDKGLFEITGRDGKTTYKTYITSGLGTSGPRARLFNPPEVVILDINL